MYVFFFFSSRRRHTRSKRDWSSDVCSSDLDRLTGAAAPAPPRRSGGRGRDRAARHRPGRADRSSSAPRSEERRVGKECRSRWWQEHLKKKRQMSEVVSRSVSDTNEHDIDYE